jgi:hypothetical protein
LFSADGGSISHEEQLANVDILYQCTKQGQIDLLSTLTIGDLYVKKMLLVSLFTTYLTLIGCASNGPTILGNEKLSQNEQLSQTEALQKGLIRLDCVLSCSGKFGANSKEIDGLFNAHAWNELARRVMDIGYGNNLAYYYLGSVAEAQGYFPAAKTYYQISLAVTLKCDAVIKSNCYGHNFPDDINKNLAKIEEK